MLNFESTSERKAGVAKAAPADPPPVLTIVPGAWVVDAACGSQPPEFFFPEGQGSNYQTGKKVCAGCEVRAECLAFALEIGDKWGLYGGFTPEERSKLRRRTA